MPTERYKDRVNNDDNVSKAYSYLVEEKGLAPHIASGILGNFMQESGHKLDVQAYNPDDMGSESFGLAQWRADRLDNLKKVAGDRMNTLEGQLDFMLWEFENTEKRAFSKLQEAEDARDAALIFSKHYERPHKDYAHNDKRMANALKIFNGAKGAPGDEYEANIDPSEERQKAVVKDNIPAVESLPTVKKVEPQTVDKMNQQLAYQNTLILERLTKKEEEEKKEEESKSKTQAAQANLNAKMQQKQMLQELIMKAGAKYVDSPSRRPSNEPIQGVEIPQFEHGGKHKKSDEVYHEELPEVVVTHDKSEYADRKAREQQQLLDEIDRKMGRIREGVSGEVLDERLEGVKNRTQIQQPILKEEELKPNTLIEKLDVNNYETKEEVMELQRTLLEKGYDLGNYGQEKDGIDGMVGKMTMKALNAYNKGLDPRDVIQEISKDQEKKNQLKEKLKSGILTLEEEEELIRNQRPKEDGKLEELGEYLYDNVSEHISQPVREAVSSVLPHNLQFDPELETVGNYNNTPGARKILIEDHSIGEIRKEKNISFGQISRNGRMSNMVLPTRLKERAVNATYPQGYGVDINDEKEGLAKFEAINRFLSEESKDGQVKRLPGKKGDYREDIYRMYSGLPQKHDTFTISSFKAGSDSDSNITFKDPETVADYALIAASSTDLFKKLASGEITPETIAEENASGKKGGEKINKAGFRDPKNVMWNATFGVGFDKAGKPYLSFYDNWDLAGKDDNMVTGAAFGAPIEIYDRIPLTEDMIQKFSRIQFSAHKDGASDGLTEDGEKQLYRDHLKDKEVSEAYEELLKLIKNRY